MTCSRSPCTFSSRVIGRSSQSGPLQGVVTLGTIGQMALTVSRHKCQHYSDSVHPRGGDEQLHGAHRPPRHQILMAETARGAPAILDGLTRAQREAVAHETGPLLIIAGAGTGKTTVITRRIAHLIARRRARPSEVLALTFTD